MTLRLLFLLFTALILTQCTSTSLPVERSQPLAEVLEQARKQMQIPGTAIGVYRGTETVLERGFGLADVKADQPVTPHTLFRVASVSKMFLGAVALRLAERGVISLDDPLSKYRPDIPDADKITLRMLGDNTSGLRNFISLKEVKKNFAERPTRLWSREELIQLSVKAGPHFQPPGSGWMYSNTNALLLAFVLEKATSQTWSHLLRQEVILPLKLRDTRMEHGIPSGLARGYQYGDTSGPTPWKGAGNVLHDVTNDSPSKWAEAGDIVSSLRDLRVFMQAMMKGPYLKDSSREQQRRFHQTGYPVDYRYGFALSAYEDTVGHSGMIPGYQACAAYHAATDTCVIVLANVYSTPRWEEPANYLFFTIMEWLTGRSYTPRL